MISDKEIIKKIRKSVGKPVTYIYPQPKGIKRGILIDRVIGKGTSTQKGVQYWNVVDLIEFIPEEGGNHIRIGYYRQTEDNLRWAGQTTITAPIEEWKKLLVQAAKEKKWFREFLLAVVEKI